MSFGFSTIEHAVAYAAQKVVNEAKALSVLAAKLEPYQPALDAVTAEINPQAVLIERGAFTALGLLSKAASDTSNIQSNGGVLNIKADAALIADFKSLYSYLTTHLAHSGITTSPGSSGTPAATIAP